jgi:hypothetical protein
LWIGKRFLNNIYSIFFLNLLENCQLWSDLPFSCQHRSHTHPVGWHFGWKRMDTLSKLWRALWLCVLL